MGEIMKSFEMRRKAKIGSISGKGRLSAFLFATCMLTSGFAQAACPLTAADRGFVKWNPGHYMMIDGKNQDIRLANFLYDYKNVPAVKGVQITYYWSELNPSPGVYKFDEIIGPDITKLATQGKKLAIVIGYKYQISDTQSSLPNYVLKQANVWKNGVSVPPYFEQGKAGDGAYNEGQHANFGHPGTLSKFNTLLSALSAKYDKNPNVASLSFIETSTGADIRNGGKYPAILGDMFLNGVLAMERHAGCTFKHTPLFQNLNFPRNRLPDFTNNLKAYGIGLGGPDVFVDSMKYVDNGLGFFGFGDTITKYPGVYHYYPTMSQFVPIGQQVHYENLHYLTREDMLPPPGVEHNLTPAQAVDGVYNFSVQQLKPNYMFWQVYGPEKDVLENRLKAAGGAGLPLRTACPPIYGNKCTTGQ